MSDVQYSQLLDRVDKLAMLYLENPVIYLL